MHTSKNMQSKLNLIAVTVRCTTQNHRVFCMTYHSFIRHIFCLSPDYMNCRKPRICSKRLKKNGEIINGSDFSPCPLVPSLHFH